MAEQNNNSSKTAAAGTGCCCSGCLLMLLVGFVPVAMVLLLPFLAVQGIIGSTAGAINELVCMLPDWIVSCPTDTSESGENAQTDKAVLGFTSPIKNITFTAPEYPWGAPQKGRPGLHHFGVDLGSTDGDTSVYAMIDAKVYKTHSGFDNSYSSLPKNIEGRNIYGIENYNLEQGGGNQVILEFEHEAWPGKKVYLNYVHLASVAVSAGQQVKQGDYLGEYGQSGGAQGAHLHLTLASGSSWANAVDEDPMRILSGLPGSESMPGYRKPEEE